MNENTVNFEIFDDVETLSIRTSNEKFKQYNIDKIPRPLLYITMNTITTAVNNAENYSVTFTIG